MCENVELEFSCAGVELWKNDGFYVLLALFIYFFSFVTAEEKMMGEVC